MQSAATISVSRNEAIKAIRKNLKARSGKAWSVTGGRGTAWGWIYISCPPSREDDHGCMCESDRKELADLLGLDAAHMQGVSVPASSSYYREYVARSEGRTPEVHGEQYWD